MYGHRLIRELLGLLFIFCGLLLLLSLWSYDPADPTFNQAVTVEASAIRNSAGLFGAFLSGFFVDIIGIASYLWVVFFLAVGAAFVSRWLVLKWYRWIGYTMLFACLIMAASAWDLSFHGIKGGGLAGQWLSAFSFLLFRSIGSMLVWAFIFLAGMELAFSISWLGLAVGAYDWIASRLKRGDREEAQDDEQEEAPRRRRFASLAEILSRRRQKEEEPDRPVLDIILERDEDVEEPQKASGVIALPLHMDPAGEDAGEETTLEEGL
ncbi:MAG: DNA translocase FtsK 4TM domain-containing protein, partial [Mailhella sp.]|nr:DNA translocase FtsK 4TM domain-containing protein [Mailhella sp.]